MYDPGFKNRGREFETVRIGPALRGCREPVEFDLETFAMRFEFVGPKARWNDERKSEHAADARKRSRNGE